MASSALLLAAARPGSRLVSSWKAKQLPGPVISQGTLQRELPGDVIYSVRLNPPCSVWGVAVARSTTLSRKGWPEPGSWQWWIKAITDLDVIQSKPPSSWTNLQLRGSCFKLPLYLFRTKVLKPFLSLALSLLQSLAALCHVDLLALSGMQSYAFPNELLNHVPSVNFLLFLLKKIIAETLSF